MKAKLIFIFLFLAVSFVSCNKDTHVFKIENNQQSNKLEERVGNGSEADIAAFYSYQVSLGKQYHSWMLSKISTSDWNALTSSDRSIILNFTDPQYTMLAMYYEAVVNKTLPPNYYSSSGSPASIEVSKKSKKGVELYLTPSEDHFLDCVSVAFGISEINAAINIGSLNAAAASKSTVRILKAVGRRYIGWLGVALMVRDFYNCYNGF